MNIFEFLKYSEVFEKENKRLNCFNLGCWGFKKQGNR